MCCLIPFKGKPSFNCQELTETVTLINELSNDILSKCLTSTSLFTKKNELPCQIQETSQQALDALLEFYYCLLQEILDDAKQGSNPQNPAIDLFCSATSAAIVHLEQNNCSNLHAQKNIYSEEQGQQVSTCDTLDGRLNKKANLRKKNLKWHNNSNPGKHNVVAKRYCFSGSTYNDVTSLQRLYHNQFIESSCCIGNISQKTYNQLHDNSICFASKAATRKNSRSRFKKKTNQTVIVTRNQDPSSDCLARKTSVQLEPKKLTEKVSQKRYCLYYHYEPAILYSSPEDEDSNWECLLQRCYEVECSSKTHIALNLCLPYFTLLEQLTKIATLSKAFYNAVMSNIQFMDLVQDKEVVWLPAFSRQIVPNVSQTLRWIRLDCTEHVLFASALGESLEKLVLSNVPAVTTSRSSLLTIQLKEATEATYKALYHNDTKAQIEETDRYRDINSSVEILQSLHPLSGWLYSAISRCQYLKALRIEFFPEFPFVISARHASSCYVSSENGQAFGTSGNSLVDSIGSKQSMFGCTNTQISALFFKKHLSDTEAEANYLCFKNLTSLVLHHIVSSFPLTLILGISFPKLKSLVLSTTVGFSTSNLVEFLKLFSWVKGFKESSTPLHTLIIHHESNIADSRLLESLELWSELQVLQLTSDVSYGTDVILSHPTLVRVVISFSRQLSWKFRLPKLKHLILLILYDSTAPDCLSSMKLSKLLLNVLEFSPYLETFNVLDSVYQTHLLCLNSRKAILKEAAAASVEDI